MDNPPDNEHRAARLNWHPAFLQAIQLELLDWKGFLEFKYEYQLATEPLRMDLLIIKKPKDIIIDKNIARIFRADNILEFKSPEDYLSVKDFLKVYAYANLHAAITPGVDFSEMTLTFVESRYPRKLLNYLRDTRRYMVEETGPGIHTVSGDYLPIQIIETRKLAESENLWLKSLNTGLESRSAGVILEESRKRIWADGKSAAALDAYLDVLLHANSKTFLEVRRMNGAATFEEVFTEAGIIPEWIERGFVRGREQGIAQGKEQGITQGREQGIAQGKEKIARNLLALGMSTEETAGVTELPVEKVRALLNGDDTCN